MDNRFLQHYGILGMHWGVHRTSTPVTTLRRGKVVPKMKLVKGHLVPVTSTKTTITVTKPEVKKTGSEDHQKKMELKSKPVHELSNAELKILTNRLQLEKQLKDLNPKEFNRGLKLVKDVTAAGTTLASLYALSKTPLAKDVAKILSNQTK